MLTPDEAGARYRKGIEKIGGAAAYIECGGKKGGGFLAVAKCLHDKKVEKLTTDGMVERYKAAA